MSYVGIKAFSGLTAPENPERGWMWFDESINSYKFWDGSKWALLQTTTISGSSSVSVVEGVVQVTVGGIKAEHIGAEQIETGALKAGSVDATKIKAGSIETGNIKAEAITTALLAANSVTAGKIAAEQIETTHLKAESVDASKIKANSIESKNIKAEAIEAAAIKSDAIESKHIKAGAVEASELAANSVTAEKIIANAVEASKIKAEAVETSKIKAEAVDATKIKALAVEAGHIKAEAIETGKIKAEAITTAKLAAEAVDTTKLKANTIEAGDIKAGTITSTEIASSTITGSNIAGSTITAAKLTISEISSISANLGSITSGTITGATLRTAASGKRWEVNSNEAVAYNASEAKVFYFNIATGDLQIKGKLLEGSEIPATTVTGQLTNAQIKEIEAAKVTSFATLTNQIPNPGFEGSDITDLNTGNCTIAINTEFAKSGTQSLKITSTASADMVVSRTPAKRLTVTGEQNLFAAGEFRPGSTTRKVRVRIRFWEAAEKEVGPEVIGAEVTQQAEQFVRAFALGKAPATAVKAAARFEVIGPTAGEVHYLDETIFVKDTTSVQPFWPTPTQLSANIAKFTGTENASTSIYRPLGLPVNTELVGKLTDAQLEAIAAAKITGTITETQIGTDAVTTPKIKAEAVEAAKIATGAVTAEKLIANAVEASKIKAGAVEATKLAVNAVTAEKIEAGAVITAKIAAGAIVSEKIAAGEVKATNIATDAVEAKHIKAGSIETAELAANAVVAEKIAAKTITVSEIATETIAATNIATDAIIARTIKSEAITASKVEAKAIDATKLNVSELSAITANAGLIESGTFRGPVFETTSSNPKVRMDSTGFFATDASGNRLVDIPKSGSPTFKGFIKAEGLEVPTVTGEAEGTANSTIFWSDGTNAHAYAKGVWEPNVLGDSSQVQIGAGSGNYKFDPTKAQAMIQALATTGAEGKGVNNPFTRVRAYASGQSVNIIDAGGKSHFVKNGEYGDRKLNRGETTEVANGAELEVAHGLEAAPVAVILTPVGVATQAHVVSVTSTKFKFKNDAGASKFYWMAMT